MTDKGLVIGLTRLHQLALTAWLGKEHPLTRRVQDLHHAQPERTDQ